MSGAVPLDRLDAERVLVLVASSSRKGWLLRLRGRWLHVSGHGQKGFRVRIPGARITPKLLLALRKKVVEEQTRREEAACSPQP